MCSVLSLLSLSFWLFVVFILAVLQFLAVLSEWWMNHFAQNTYNKGWGFYLGLYGLVFTTGSVMMVVARGMYAPLCATMRHYALLCAMMRYYALLCTRLPTRKRRHSRCSIYRIHVVASRSLIYLFILALTYYIALCCIVRRTQHASCMRCVALHGPQAGW
jgi:hypothetical protein